MLTKSELRQIIVEEIERASPEAAAAIDLLNATTQSTQNELDKIDDPKEIETFLSSFIALFIKQSEQESSNVRQILTNLGNAILKMDKEENSS